MFTYSRQQLERQLLEDQALWRRFPTSVAAILWPLEILALGWSTGWWAGALTVVLLGAASLLLPPRLAVNIYLIDLLEWLVRLPTRLGWLLLVWHLWLREPLFPLLGQPLLGAVAITALLMGFSHLLAFLSTLVARLALSRGQG